jgi:hypothetical protein
MSPCSAPSPGTPWVTPTWTASVTGPLSGRLPGARASPRPERAAAWRERIPAELPAVLQELAAERIGYALRKGRPLLEPTVGFWNGLVHE